MPRAATRGPDLERRSQRDRIPDHNRQLEHISRTHIRISSFPHIPGARNRDYLRPTIRPPSQPQPAEPNGSEQMRTPTPTETNRPCAASVDPLLDREQTEPCRTKPNKAERRNYSKRAQNLPFLSTSIARSPAKHWVSSPRPPERKILPNREIGRKIAQREHALSPWFRI